MLGCGRHPSNSSGLQPTLWLRQPEQSRLGGEGGSASADQGQLGGKSKCLEAGSVVCLGLDQHPPSEGLGV